MKNISARKGFIDMNEWHANGFELPWSQDGGETVKYDAKCLPGEIIMAHGYNCTAQNVFDAYRSNLEMAKECGFPENVSMAGYLWAGRGENWTEVVRFRAAEKAADYGGLRLADYLKTGPPERPAVIIGHSLGSRVALEAVTRGGATADVLVLLGAAVDNESLRTKYADARARKIVVFSSQSDSVLRKMYLLSKMDFALGAKGPDRKSKELPWVKHYDVTSLVSDHSGYRHSRFVWKTILKEIEDGRSS